MVKRFIITNFAYGFGPFLRTTELALATAERLSKKTGEKFSVIVPWVYGEPQKRILQEEFGEVLKLQPDAIVLDREIGAQLELLFYGEKGYEHSLSYFRANHRRVSDAINHMIQNGLTAETMSGEVVSISKSEIALCISRAPRVFFDFEYSYYTSFAYVSEIHERSLALSEFSSDPKLRSSVIPLLTEIEKQHRLHFIADPGTFTPTTLARGAIHTPPNAAPPQFAPLDSDDPGIYVTMTGIPGLERLFQESQQTGLKIYSNKSARIPNSIRALPHVLRSPQIKLHFARAGWGSIWYSLFTGVPLITPPFDPSDDPEIYFNQLCIQELGIGMVYRGQSLPELLAYREPYQNSAVRETQRLLSTYGTLNGVEYTADQIAKDFEGNR